MCHVFMSCCFLNGSGKAINSEYVKELLRISNTGTSSSALEACFLQHLY